MRAELQQRDAVLGCCCLDVRGGVAVREDSDDALFRPAPQILFRYVRHSPGAVPATSRARVLASQSPPRGGPQRRSMGPSAPSQEQGEAGPSGEGQFVDACALSTEALVAWCRDGQQAPSSPSTSSSAFHPDLRQFAVRAKTT